MIDSFEVIFYSAVFIVPGYILFSVLQSLVPRQKTSLVDATLKFITATLIHYTIWSWLIYQMFNNKIFLSHKVLLYILVIFVVIISPCLLGLILAKISDKKIVLWILNIFGYNPINPIPTAWDYTFSKMPEKSWIIVTLKDGKTFYGKYSTKSFASSESSERDIFIEDVYTLEKDGKWKNRERNIGVLIVSEEIKYIEFFTN